MIVIFLWERWNGTGFYWFCFIAAAILQYPPLLMRIHSLPLVRVTHSLRLLIFFLSDIKQNLELLLLSFCLISSRCQFSGNLEVVRWFRLSIPNHFLPHQQQIHLLASTLIRLQLLHLNRPRQEIIPPQFVARSIILKALGQIYANDFILNLIHRWITYPFS